MNEREAAVLLHRLMRAINDHDLDTLVAFFHPQYESLQPVHPERSFLGRTRVAENWGWVFERFEDFQADVVDFAVRDCTVWSEWIWCGTGLDEDSIEVRGVMIFQIEDDQLRRGRLYMEMVR